MQMLEAIQEVHDKGFIHRDIKAVSGIGLNGLVKFHTWERQEVSVHC